MSRYDCGKLVERWEREPIWTAAGWRTGVRRWEHDGEDWDKISEADEDSPFYPTREAAQAAIDAADQARAA